MTTNIYQTTYKKVFFDCDSTLTAIEGVDWLAEHKGVGNIVKQLTQEAMNGHLSFESILKQRLDIIKPTLDDLLKLGQKYIQNCLPDAKKSISLLHQQQIEVYIITGGYRPAVEILARWLGIDTKHVFAIDLNFNSKGIYIGVDTQNPLTQNGGKGKIIKKLTQNSRSMLIGDGATDLEAKDAVDIFIGFGGIVCRPLVREQADIYINIASLMPIVALTKLPNFIC